MGCDPAWKAQGFVEDGSGAPIEGATVAVVCPDGKPSDTVKTTTTGRFEVGGIGGSRALGCSLEVKKAGWRLRTMHMTDACFRSAKTHDYDEPCRAREGHIVLTPE